VRRHNLLTVAGIGPPLAASASVKVSTAYELASYSILPAHIHAGQIVAQALDSANQTIKVPSFRVHSLHAHFVRPGDVNFPMDYIVDTPLDGRRFVARSITASQRGKTVAVLSSSWVKDETFGVTAVPGAAKRGAHGCTHGNSATLPQSLDHQTEEAPWLVAERKKKRRQALTAFTSRDLGQSQTDAFPGPDACLSVRPFPPN
jgi:acyl-CoA thioesterase II